MSLVNSPEEALSILNDEDGESPNPATPIVVGSHIPGFTTLPDILAMKHYVVDQFPGETNNDGVRITAAHDRIKEMKAEKLFWVLTNCNGRWAHLDMFGYTWGFEFEEDAILFKFAWADEPLYKTWVDNYVSPIGEWADKIEYYGVKHIFS